jgi:hypothetical protein
MEKQAVYPIVVRLDSKDVEIGSMIVEATKEHILGMYWKETDIMVKEIKLLFEKGDYLTKVVSSWR